MFDPSLLLFVPTGFRLSIEIVSELRVVHLDVDSLDRLPFSLFTSQQQSGLGKSYQEIQLQDLSASEAQNMVEAMLASENIPGDLRRFIQEKVEGNPFYLEEVINALIESKILIRDNGDWKLTQSIQELELSSSVYGVISSRLDRLELDTKRVLQEASVIGRAFLYDILTTGVLLCFAGADPQQ